MAAANDDPVVLTQLGGSGLTVLLTGGLLPERGLSDPVSQRMSRTWLPGAEEPVTQVMGPSQDAVTLTGYARDEMAGEGAAQTLDARLRRMAREGVPVRLEWGGQLDKVVMIERYAPEWDDLGSLRWTLEVAVDVSHGDEARPARPAMEAIEDLAREADAAVAEARALLPGGAP